jgi:hypothetical protein
MEEGCSVKNGEDGIFLVRICRITKGHFIKTEGEENTLFKNS